MSNSFRFALAPLLIVSSLFLPTPTAARMWQVPSGAPTIQAGIDSCAVGDTVVVACGTYEEHDLAMKSGIVLRSESGIPECVTIDAQQQGRVMLCEDADESTAFVGLTFTGGLAEGSGAAGYGGGVYCTHTSARFLRCTFLNNAALAGGGMRVRMSDPEVYRSRFIDNRVDQDGAGMCCTSGSPFISYCLFQDNAAGWWGGAMEITGHELSAVVTNCTMIGNSAVHAGGAIFSGDQCPFILSNSIITKSLLSSAVYILDEPGFLGIECCNVFDNEVANYGGELPDQTGINGNISVPPLFCGPADDDFRLAEDSPCLPENNECGVLMGTFEQGCGPAAAAPSPPVLWGQPGRLAANPNPFNARTTLHVRLHRPSHLFLAIHDVAGRLVTTLAEGPCPAGEFEVVWDGRDSRGAEVGPGVYLYTLAGHGRPITGRLVRVR